MTLNQFNQLSAEGQRQTVLLNGVFLAAHETRHSIILLYQVDGFYIEVFSCKKEQAIVMVRAFESTEQLEPYLDEIDVTEMVSSF